MALLEVWYDDHDLRIIEALSQPGITEIATMKWSKL
jgi:hypothetical protein